MARMSALQRKWYWLYLQERLRKLRVGDDGSKPTASFDFLNSSSLISSKGKTMTFSRGTGATQYDSTGKLIYAHENLALNSNNFAGSNWLLAQATITSNALSLPLTGGYTKLQETIDNNVHRVLENTSFGYATVRMTTTASIYAKAAERQYFYMNVGGSLGVHATFDLIGGTYISSGTGTVDMVLQSDGGYLCSITGIYTGSTIFGLQINHTFTVGDDNYAGTAGNGIYISGIQIDRSSYPRPYNATTSSPYYGQRWDYDPLWLTPKGILIEEQRVNACLFSKNINAITQTSVTPPQINGGSWGYDTVNPLVNNTQPDIMGFSEASLLSLGNVSNNYDMYTPFTGLTSGQQYTFSCWVKLGTATNFALTVNDASAWNNLTGSKSLTAADGLNTFKFTRVNITTTANARGVINFHIGVHQNSDHAQQSVGTVYYYGLQMENGSFPTSYIPTYNAAVTRATDVLNLPCSSFYNLAEGTFFMNVIPLSVQTNNGLFQANDGTTQNRIDLRSQVAGSILSYVISGNTVYSSTNGSQGQSASVINKYGMSYKAGAQYISMNGAVTATTAPSTMPVGINNIQIGNLDGSSGAPFNGWVQAFNYYNMAQTNAEIDAATALTYSLNATPYINALKSASITNQMQFELSDQFIQKLTRDGVWSKSVSIFPIVGGTASAHAINAKSPGTNNMVWNGSPTHSANGVKGDGTAGCYGNTGIIPNAGTLSYLNSTMAFYTNNTATADGSIDMGVSQSGNVFALVAPFTDSQIRQYNGIATYVGGTTKRNGLFGATTGGALSYDNKGYQNGANISSIGLNAAAGATYTSSITTLGVPSFGGSDQPYQMLFIGQALNDADHANLFQATQALQIRMGRAI